MKHLKTFESFSINELQDWATLPVDVHAGMGDLYGQIGKEIKSAFGNAYDEFMEQLENFCEFSSLSSRDAQKMVNSATKFFGQDSTKLTATEIKRLLEKKFPTKFPPLRENLMFNSWMDKYDKTNPYETDRDEEGTDTHINDVKGGIVQKIGFILQQVFAINLLTFGLPAMFVSSLIGIMVSWASWMFISLIAFIIVHIIRKLHKMIVGYK